MQQYLYKDHSIAHELKSGILIMMLLVFMFPNLVAAAAISVTVDRNPVAINDSFHIIFSTTTSPDGDPDFSPLDKDFEILNQSQSSNYSLINGVASKQQTWTLEVMARRTGQLTIPAIAFGDDRSQPVALQVNGKADQPADINAGEDLFLRASAKPEQPYVQAQVIYTLRLYRRLNIIQAALTEPELDDAVVTRLGEDKNYNTVIDGKNYVVTERKYALFPQKSGAIEIPPMVLTAEITGARFRSRFDSFFNSRPTRRKKVLSNPVTLDVQPVPEAMKNQHWLPASEVQLEQRWSGDITQMKVGEPLTRTVKLRATGATVGQLPEMITYSDITSEDSQGRLKSYPDQPVLTEQPHDGELVAVREEKVAFIPSKAGVYHLPAIEIPWWNTQTQQLETARIPAMTITAVKAGADDNVQEPPALSDVEIKPAKTAAANIVDQPLQRNPWMWVSMVLALGWLATVLYFMSRPQRSKPEKTMQQEKPGQTDWIRKIQQACRENDAKAAKDALIQWGRQEFGESSLGRIAIKCESPLKDEIIALNQSLYSPQASDWNGQDLAKAINKYNSDKTSDRKDQNEVLQPLFRQ